MADLAPCPCGETPEQLCIATESGRWGQVSGDCCGLWSIEFRANYKHLDDPECYARAKKAWNEAPRTEQTTCEWQEMRDCDWTTACGAIWRTQEEGPTGEDLAYCPHCGGKVLAKPYERT